MRITITILSLLLISALFAATVSLAWVVNGNPVGANEETEFYPCMTSDMAGGAIVAWEADRPHPDPHNIFGNRISSTGGRLWEHNGVSISRSDWLAIGPPDIESDGAGGAIYCFTGLNGANEHTIRAGRKGPTALTFWGPDCAELCTDQGLYPYPSYPRLTTDGAGGAIVVWYDQRDTNHDLYARRVDAGGTVLWTQHGVAICTEEHDQTLHQIVSDSAGGAIIVWRDHRVSFADVYAQRIDANGVIQWTVDGLPINTDSGVQDTPQLTADGVGGAIITWVDADIMAQRVDASGNLLWGAGGVAVCDIVGGQSDPQIASDGYGGAVFCWRDTRVGAGGIYTQRLDAAGNALWTAQGVAVCFTTDAYDDIRIVGNGSGGAVVAWMQKKTSYDNDIYARVVDATGIPVGSAGGTPLCTDLATQYDISIVTDGAGGGIVCWQDSRGATTGTASDIYAARIYANGTTEVILPRPEVATLAQNYPNPFNPCTTIRYVLPEPSAVCLRIYDVSGRLVRELVRDVAAVAGRHETTWNGQDDSGQMVAAGVYFYQLEAGAFSETKRMTLVK